MITLRFGAPDAVTLPERLRLVLRQMRAGYVLRAVAGPHGVAVWLDSSAPVAFSLDAADLAHLLDCDMVDEDPAAATDATSTYVLTKLGAEWAGRTPEATS